MKPAESAKMRRGQNGKPPDNNSNQPPRRRRPGHKRVGRKKFKNLGNNNANDDQKGPSTSMETATMPAADESIAKTMPTTNQIFTDPDTAVHMYKDMSGTIFEWDETKRAWFPKIDEEFLADYYDKNYEYVPKPASNPQPEPPGVTPDSEEEKEDEQKDDAETKDEEGEEKLVTEEELEEGEIPLLEKLDENSKLYQWYPERKPFQLAPWLQDDEVTNKPSKPTRKLVQQSSYQFYSLFHRLYFKKQSKLTTIEGTNPEGLPPELLKSLEDKLKNVTEEDAAIEIKEVQPLVVPPLPGLASATPTAHPAKPIANPNPSLSSEDVGIICKNFVPNVLDESMLAPVRHKSSLLPATSGSSGDQTISRDEQLDPYSLFYKAFIEDAEEIALDSVSTKALPNGQTIEQYTWDDYCKFFQFYYNQLPSDSEQEYFFANGHLSLESEYVRFFYSHYYEEDDILEAHSQFSETAAEKWKKRKREIDVANAKKEFLKNEAKKSESRITAKTSVLAEEAIKTKLLDTLKSKPESDKHLGENHEDLNCINKDKVLSGNNVDSKNGSMNSIGVGVNLKDTKSTCKEKDVEKCNDSTIVCVNNSQGETVNDAISKKREKDAENSNTCSSIVTVLKTTSETVSHQSFKSVGSSPPAVSVQKDENDMEIRMDLLPSCNDVSDENEKSVISCDKEVIEILPKSDNRIDTEKGLNRGSVEKVIGNVDGNSDGIVPDIVTSELAEEIHETATSDDVLNKTKSVLIEIDNKDETSDVNESARNEEVKMGEKDESAADSVPAPVDGAGTEDAIDCIRTDEIGSSDPFKLPDWFVMDSLPDGKDPDTMIRESVEAIAEKRVKDQLSWLFEQGMSSTSGGANLAALCENDIEQLAVRELKKEAKRRQKNSIALGVAAWSRPAIHPNKRFLNNLLVSTLRDPIRRRRGRSDYRNFGDRNARRQNDGDSGVGKVFGMEPKECSSSSKPKNPDKFTWSSTDSDEGGDRNDVKTCSKNQHDRLKYDKRREGNSRYSPDRHCSHSRTYNSADRSPRRWERGRFDRPVRFHRARYTEQKFWADARDYSNKDWEGNTVKKASKRRRRSKSDHHREKKRKKKHRKKKSKKKSSKKDDIVLISSSDEDGGKKRRKRVSSKDRRKEKLKKRKHSHDETEETEDSSEDSETDEEVDDSDEEVDDSDDESVDDSEDDEEVDDDDDVAETDKDDKSVCDDDGDDDDDSDEEGELVDDSDDENEESDDDSNNDDETEEGENDDSENESKGDSDISSDNSDSDSDESSRSSVHNKRKHKHKHSSSSENKRHIKDKKRKRERSESRHRNHKHKRKKSSVSRDHRKSKRHKSHHK